MTTAPGTFRHRDYTVAWICALPLEMAAAASMLDERHPGLPARPNDSNAYILGRIYGHNVAIACLPSGVYGTTSATVVAIQMQSTFESIRFGLMIGIGGGVPSRRADIRLGDVVISKPTTNLGGVIQYDYGKTVNGGHFERTGALNKPPPVLLTALAKLQAEHMLTPSRIPALLSEAVARNPGMREKFAYRGEDQDILFDSEYDHTDSGDTCDNCDARKLVTRPPRYSHDPVIHYGLIASGNQVMKHGQSREKLARELDILCFEMEAAGLMDNFPCLVIRGICDYSDSHKNKQWQAYAATTAAAYGKELLSEVHSSHVVDTLPAGSIYDMSYCREKPSYMAKLPRSEIFRSSNAQEDEDEEILERISTYDHGRIHRRLTRKRLTGTTRWFTNHRDFKAWFFEKKVSSLWCSGNIGSGKTMIATAVIDAAKYELGCLTVFFYCETEHRTGLSASAILSSFIRQLCGFIRRTSKRYPENIEKEIRKFFGPKRVQPDLDDLKDIFNLCFRCVPDTVYIVDGLDALDQEHAKHLLELFRLLFHKSESQKGSRILLLSRDQVPGYINISTFIPGIRQISTSANVLEDIAIYIESSITDKTMRRKLTDDHLLVQEIQQRLLMESSGMFLWVYLQLEILWDTCHTDAEIRSALSALPKGLEETYSRCIERINENDNRALKVLRWVSFATRPLHIEELREAVTFGPEDTAWNVEKIPRKEFVIGCCANLVVVDSTDDHVRFAHSSVKQYLEKGREREIMPWYPTTAQGVLECGEFCIAYLSFSDFSLQLSTRREEKALVTVVPPILVVQQTLPRFLTRKFFQGSRNQKRSTPIPFRAMRTPSTPNRMQYKLLAYAVTNWALQTKEIHRESASWENFERLAMSFNQTWNFHPWAPGGRSFSSHLHSLFGWAVKEQHGPLLSIAQNAGVDFNRVCNLPLIDESLPALHVAAKLGYNGIFEILLGFCNVNLPDLEGYTALHHAASKGHLEICQLLSKAKQIKLNAPSRWQATPLSQAAENGHDAVVKLLLEKRADIEAKGKKGQTPLSCAVISGHEAVVKLLLENGADIEAKYQDWTPLLWAAFKGPKAMVKLLLGKGADIEAKDKGGQTPLLSAAFKGHKAMVKLLLENGADIETKNKEGRTPLLWAAFKGHKAVVKLLLENGADIETKNKEGRTPLLCATIGGYEAVVKLLLENGADIETKNKEGRTPLLWAVFEGQEAVVKLLLEKGADIEAKDKEGQTPLSCAVISGHEAVVKLLLENGADIEAKYQDWTPLLSAAFEGHKAVVKLLLENGADIEAKYQDWTPLLWAAFEGKEAVVKLLLGKGADIEAKDKEGQTPLLCATIGGYEAVVKLLLENGADIEAKDEKGWTPLSWATAEGHEAVAKLLSDKMLREGEKKVENW
ncbi:hypothetical protein N7540_004402 [Penicillium herquei]|nr:hypothetical protein N7540_004402 [Penicillium herquei]